jgi:predicted enzyme related to lactoylglutathione lyase
MAASRPATTISRLSSASSTAASRITPIDGDAAGARLTGLGATLDREIQQREYGRMANLADPFGNGFDLIEFSGSGYDGVSR